VTAWGWSHMCTETSRNYQILPMCVVRLVYLYFYCCFNGHIPPMETVFSMWFVPKYYKPGKSSSEIEVVSSSAEWSDVKYLVGEWESSVVSSAESQPVKTRRLVWNGRQPATQSADVLHGRLWQEDQSAGSWRIATGKAVARKRLVKTVLDWGH
jgi:hypothetical protein